MAKNQQFPGQDAIPEWLQTMLESKSVSWILTIIMLSAVWPIGLILLFRTLSNGALLSPIKRSRRRIIDVEATEIHDAPEKPAPQKKAPPKPAAAQRPVTQPARRTPITIGRHWGRWLMIAGVAMAGFFGFCVVNRVADALFFGGGFGSYYFLRELMYLTGLTATGLVLLAVGIGRRRKAGRYRRYVTLIGRQESLNIDTLAKAMPVSYRRACEDLQDMLEAGYLPAGYIDALEHRIVFSEGGIREKTPRPKPAPAPAAKPVQEDDILAQIRAVNDAIADEAMSRKIDRIGEITGKILDYQRKNPDSAAELHSFLDYYLPTTLKLLRSYAQLEAQGVEGRNIRASKAQIESAMDKVVEGFERQLDKLFQPDAVDITSDIQVLEQMLQKDGLTDSEILWAEP